MEKNNHIEHHFIYFPLSYILLSNNIKITKIALFPNIAIKNASAATLNERKYFSIAKILCPLN